MCSRFLLSCVAAFLLISTASAQTDAPSSPAANPVDVASIDGIITALYDVISGEAGEPRDWDRMRSLFLPEAHLMPTQMRPDSSYLYRMMTVDQYIETSGPWLIDNGFFEGEVARRTERFENIAHVWTTYDSRRTQDGPVFMRGINSIQLFHDGSRWWIATVMWTPETPPSPLPTAYLGDG